MGSAKNSTIHKTLAEHIQELRVCFTWIAIWIAAGTILAYSIQKHLVNILQAPLGQTLYYSSPTGGFAFIFKLCIVAGIIFALPAILYNLFHFIHPILERAERRSLIYFTLWSFVLAYVGIAFAYFISLPSALHFLTGFGDKSIQSLISANEYFNFAITYVGGFAFLFQLPLIVLFINRIKPLKPSGMMRYQRYVILGSFIIAAILTPTPDPFNQLMMAAPIIVLYQFSIGIIFFVNRSSRRAPQTFTPIAKPYVKPVQQIATPRLPAQPVVQKAPVIVDVCLPQPQAASYRQPRPRPQREIRRTPISGLPTRRVLVGNDFC